jgi:hypothetical protein
MRHESGPVPYVRTVKTASGATAVQIVRSPRRGSRDIEQAVSRWIEHQTGWSIRKFVKTARRYRTIEIQAGTRTITAADPLPDDLRAALDQIHGRSTAH